MLYFAIYLLLGIVLVAQSCIRSWKYRPLRGLDDWTTAVGAVVIWPLVLFTELRQIYRQWRSR